MEQNYIAFISYRHTPQDSAVAKALHTQIEQYVIPRELRKDGKKLGRVFRDVEELPVSSDLSDDICRALDRSEYLVVVCSKDSVQSPWVKREVEYFLAHHDRQKAFTVLVSGEPGEVFPEALTHVVNEDGTVTEVEPLAMDVRAQSTKAALKRLRREMPRIFAGMIGCAYDALVMREHRRARRRTLAAAAAILAVVLAFTGLVLAKNSQIDRKNEELEAQNEEIDRQNEELEAQNEELERQRQEALLRESELLTAKAEVALTEGNRSEALSSSLAALTAEEGTRPYYAPAEAALISAMGIFDGGLSSLVTETVLEQSTPVVDFCISEDGSRLASMDEYGTITCYDTVTGDVLWATTHSAALEIYTCPGDTIAAMGNGAAGISFETGEILWTWDVEWGSRYFMGLSEDGMLGSFLVQQSNEDFTEVTFTAVVLNTADGTVYSEVLLGTYGGAFVEDAYPYAEFPAEYSTEQKNTTTAFTADHRYMVGTFSLQMSEEETVMRLFRADLETGEVFVFANMPAEQDYSTLEVYHLQLCDEDAALLILRYSAEDSCVGILEKYSLADGKQLWQTKCVGEKMEFLSSGWARYMTCRGGLILIGCQEQLLAYDAETGNYLHGCQYDEEICFLDSPEYPFFRAVLKDGSYSYGWLNSYGLMANIYSSMGSCVRAELWNGGYLELMTADGYVEGSRYSGSGFVVTVSEEDSCEIVIKRGVVPAEAYPAPGELTFAEGDSFSGASVWMYGESIAFGPIDNYSGETDTARIMLIDPENSENPLVIPCPDDLYSEDLLLLPDLSGYIVMDQFADIRLYDTEGNAQVLSESETVEISSYEDIYSFGAGKYCAAGGIRRSDGAVICARVCDDQLQLWINGEAQEPVTAPDGMCFQVYTSITIQDYVAVGAQGHVITALYADDTDSAADALGVYDPKTASWQLIRPEGADFSAFAVAANGESDLCAVVDNAGTAYFCNLSTGETENAYAMPLPLASVSQLHFLMDDEFLLVLTQSDQIWIFDTQSGEVVYRQQLEEYVRDPLSVLQEQNGTRVYISWGNGGIILESDSWTKLADVPKMMGYDPLRDTVILLGYDSRTWEDVIQLVHLPDTETLAEIARSLLTE